MERIKIFTLLKTFSEAEFKQLGLYLNSPFFNYSKKIRILYEILNKYYPEFENPELIKKRIFSSLYSDECYDDNKIRNLFKAMYHHIKGYLSLIRLEKNILESEIYYLEELSDRSQGRILLHELNEVLNSMSECNLKDENYFLRLYTLENIRIKYSENNQVIIKGDEYYENILKGIDHLTNFSLISLLKQYLKMLNAKRLHNIKARDKKIEDMIDYIFKTFKNSENLAMVNVIHEFLKLYTEDVGIGTIIALKELNENNKEHLTIEDYKSLYIELYNYCKRRQSEGSKEFGLISLDLMKEMLDKDIFLEKDGYMLDHTYINLASSAFRLNEMKWAENFIINFKNKIYPDKRDSAYNFAYALYYFFMGRKDFSLKSNNYCRALDHLSKVKIEYFYYYTRVKNLYLMLYYEMNDLIHAEPIIDTYKHYLKSNKVLPEHLNLRYSNFLSYINRLFHLRENYTPQKLIKFRNDVICDKKFEYKRWFLEKLQEME